MAQTRTPHGALLDAARTALGISQREASRRAGISEGRWRQVVTGVQKAGGVDVPVNPRPETLVAMARAVELEPVDVLVAAGVDVTGLDRDPGVAQHSDATLTDLAALPGEVAALRDRVAALEARLDDLSLHPGPFDAGVTYLPDAARPGLPVDQLRDAQHDEEIHSSQDLGGHEPS